MSGTGPRKRRSTPRKGAKRPTSRGTSKKPRETPRRTGGGQPGGIADELQPYVDQKDAAAINRLGVRLKKERPMPTAGFRTELRARLAEGKGVRPAWRPRNVRVLVAAYLGSGFALLAIAAIGLAGAGPLGY